MDIEYSTRNPAFIKFSESARKQMLADAIPQQLTFLGAACSLLQTFKTCFTA